MKMLMIPPQFLPVPAVHGGAVEKLCTSLIEGNESNHRFDIEVLSTPDDALRQLRYSHTCISEMTPGRFCNAAAKLYNKKVYATHKGHYVTPASIWVLLKVLFGSYDIILVENDMLVCSLIRKFKKRARLIYHMHNDLDGVSKSVELIHEIMPYVDSYLVISEYLRSVVAAVEPSNVIETLPNAIDIKKFDADCREEKRRELGIGEHDVVFVYSGRINKDKGVKELIEAYIRFTEAATVPTKLLIVGKSWFSTSEDDDPYTQELQKMTVNREDIIFTGFVQPSRMPMVLSAADVAVIPSRWEEPFGLVVLEAMASGLAVIATRSGAIPEILSDEEAFFIDNDDATVVADLVKMMAKASDSNARMEKVRLGKACLERHPEYDVRNYFPNFCRLISGEK